MFQNIKVEDQLDPLYEWGNFYTKYVSEIESDPVGDFTRCREVFAEIFGVDCHITDEGKIENPKADLYSQIPGSSIDKDFRLWDRFWFVTARTTECNRLIKWWSEAELFTIFENHVYIH